MGTSSESSEIQKKIRETIKHCPKAIHTKDDIIVHGEWKEYDQNLRNVLRMLHENGLTLRPYKCSLVKSVVRWFGFIFSKEGMSPDPAKCKIITDWHQNKTPKSRVFCKQYSSMLSSWELSYPELTDPLRALTNKYA